MNEQQLAHLLGNAKTQGITGHVLCCSYRSAFTSIAGECAKSNALIVMDHPLMKIVRPHLKPAMG